MRSSMKRQIYELCFSKLVNIYFHPSKQLIIVYRYILIKILLIFLYKR